jgi:hypothetical protein
LARELGGGRFAQCIAALACLMSPFVLGVSTFFSMNAFEPLVWLSAVLVVARIINTGNSRLWLLFGVIVGFGLLNKISTGMFVIGIVVGLFFTARRGDLWDRWLWFGGAAATLLFLPHVVWQAVNEFPTVEFIRVAGEQKILHMSLTQFLSAQLLYAGPLAAPIWIAGLGFLLVASGGRPYRMIGFAYLIMLVLTIAQQGKAYYLAPAYPMLLAGGGVAVEQVVRRRWLRTAVAGLVVAGGLLTAPIAVPLLPPEMLVRYMDQIGVAAPREERSHEAELPQHFSDRFGWLNMVETVARVYRSLPPEDRARAAIFTRSYGEAGAIDFFGPRFGLPRASSGHNNYWLWGAGDVTGEVVIAVGPSREALSEIFAEVTQADRVVSRYARADETNLPVFVCRKPKRPIAEIWSQVKRFI